MENTNNWINQNKKLLSIIGAVLLIAILSFVAFRFLFPRNDLVKYTDPLPAATTAGKMYTDQVRVSTENEGKYQIVGWGFLSSEPNLTPNDYERKLILSSGTDVFSLATETVQRADVQEAYLNLNMNVVNSGFLSEFSLDKLPVGTYNISILFEKSDGSTSLLNSIWVLERTADTVQLTRNK